MSSQEFNVGLALAGPPVPSPTHTAHAPDLNLLNLPPNTLRSVLLTRPNNINQN